MVAVCFCLAHSSHHNFLAIMPRREPVGVICQPFSYVSRSKYGVDFICCVDGQEPQIHKLWTFAKDGSTCEFHPFALIDVGDFSGDCFQYFFAEAGRRVSIYGQRSINWSVKWLGIPVPFKETVVNFTDNLLCLAVSCGDGVKVRAWAWEIQPEVFFGRVDVTWHVFVPFVRLTFPGVQKIRTQLRAASMTLDFWSTVWRRLKMSCTPTTLDRLTRSSPPMWWG